MEVATVEGALRFYGCRDESVRFRVRVAIEEWERVRTAAWPEPTATHFMGVCFPDHPIGQVGNPAWMRRSGSTRETSDGEVEAAPEEMDGATLADKPRAERLKHPIRLYQRAPEPRGILRIVGLVQTVLRKGCGVLEFVWAAMDGDAKLQFVQLSEQLAVEPRDGLWAKRQRLLAPIARLNQDPVVEKVEGDLESPGTMGDT